MISYGTRFKMMYPSETSREMPFQIKQKVIYRYILSTYRYIPFYDTEVCTGYILFSSSMYPKTYIYYCCVPCTYWYILVHDNRGKLYVPGTNRFMLVYIGGIL